MVLRGEGAAFSAGIDLFQLGGLAARHLRPFRRDCIEMVNLLEEMTKPVIAQIHGAVPRPRRRDRACLRPARDGRRRAVRPARDQARPDPRRGRLEPAAGRRGTRKREGADHDRALDRRGRVPPDRCREPHRPGGGARGSRRSSWTSCWRPRRWPRAREARARRCREADARGSLEQEVSIQQILVATDDFREAGAAFMEKREPRFTGAPPGARSGCPSRSRVSRPTATSGNTQAR